MTDNRNKILNAATELFLEGGLAALSVRAIAKRAELSTIGIYSHFDGKQGVLDSLYIEGFQLVAQALKASDSKNTPRQQLLASTQAYLDIADQYRAHYQLIFGETGGDYQPSADARKAGEQAFAILLEETAKILPVEASLKQKQRRALQIWALVHGYVSLKNHAVSRMVEGIDWNKMAVDAMGELLDSMQ